MRSTHGSSLALLTLFAEGIVLHGAFVFPRDERRMPRKINAAALTMLPRSHHARLVYYPLSHSFGEDGKLGPNASLPSVNVSGISENFVELRHDPRDDSVVFAEGLALPAGDRRLPRKVSNGSHVLFPRTQSASLVPHEIDRQFRPNGTLSLGNGTHSFLQLLPQKKDKHHVRNTSVKGQVMSENGGNLSIVMPSLVKVTVGEVDYFPAAGEFRQKRRQHSKHVTNSSVNNSHIVLNTSYERFRAAILGDAEDRGANTKVVGVVILVFSLFLLCGFVACDFPLEPHHPYYESRNRALDTAPPAPLQTSATGGEVLRGVARPGSISGGYQFYPPTVSQKHLYRSWTEQDGWKYGDGYKDYQSSNVKAHVSEDQLDSPIHRATPPTSGQYGVDYQPQFPPAIGQSNIAIQQAVPPPTGQYGIDYHSFPPPAIGQSNIAVQQAVPPTTVQYGVDYQSFPPPAVGQSNIVVYQATPPTTVQYGVDYQSFPPPTIGQSNTDDIKPKTSDFGEPGAVVWSGAVVEKTLDPSRIRTAAGYNQQVLPEFGGHANVVTARPPARAAPTPGLVATVVDPPPSVPPSTPEKSEGRELLVPTEVWANPLCPDLIRNFEQLYSVGEPEWDSTGSSPISVSVLAHNGSKPTLTAIFQTSAPGTSSVKLLLGDATGPFHASISTSAEGFILGDRHGRPYGEMRKMDDRAYKLTCGEVEKMRLVFDEAAGRVSLVNPKDAIPMAFVLNLLQTFALPKLGNPMLFRIQAGMDPVVAVLCVLGKLYISQSIEPREQHGLEGRDEPGTPHSIIVSPTSGVATPKAPGTGTGTPKPSGTGTNTPKGTGTGTPKGSGTGTPKGRDATSSPQLVSTLS